MSKLCAICGNEITKINDSTEHVIPQSIGGGLVVRGFICKSCNDSTGAKWDSVLAKQLNPLSLFFGVVRERGQVPSQLFKTTAGETLMQHVDGSFSPEKPLYQETSTPSGKEIRISARSDKELNKMLRDLKKNYPQVNLDELKQKVSHAQEYPKGEILYSLQVGGEEAGRSIVKTALSFAYSVGD